MKTLCKYLIVTSLLSGALLQSSCKKEFLEIEPKGYLIAKSTQDYEQMLSAIYFNSTFTASGYMGDEVAVQQSYFEGAMRRMQRLFRYDDRIYQSDEVPQEIGDALSYMQRLYIYNKIIGEVMESTGGTEQAKQHILAQAKVGRAICHLMFLNDFSVPYNSATATTDLGVPIIDRSDVTQREFVRSTVQQVYDFMIKDLTEAIPDLEALSHRRKLSRLAAETYLARIYLYMAKFDLARTHIDAAFEELGKAEIPIGLYDYNEVLAPGGEWGADMDFGFGPSNQPLAANNEQVIFNIAVSTFQANSANTFVISPETASLFDPSDKRLALLSDTELFGDFVFPKGMRRYPAFFSDIGPNLADLYLMRAELKARSNDLTGAKQDVEFLRAKRMSANITVPGNISSSQQSLVRFILEERIREFALTGSRWLDMRRLSVDPIFGNTVKYVHNAYDNEGNIVSSYELKPERFALKFGDRLLSEAVGLIDNN